MPQPDINVNPAYTSHLSHASELGTQMRRAESSFSIPNRSVVFTYLSGFCFWVHIQFVMNCFSELLPAALAYLQVTQALAAPCQILHSA
jgi:hypothetical protein